MIRQFVAGLISLRQFKWTPCLEIFRAATLYAADGFSDSHKYIRSVPQRNQIFYGCVNPSSDYHSCYKKQCSQLRVFFSSLSLFLLAELAVLRIYTHSKSYQYCRMSGNIWRKQTLKKKEKEDENLWQSLSWGTFKCLENSWRAVFVFTLSNLARVEKSLFKGAQIYTLIEQWTKLFSNSWCKTNDANVSCPQLACITSVSFFVAQIQMNKIISRGPQLAVPQSKF